MCIILPVDHIPCTHTVAIWQHCIDAPRSRRDGLKPCSRIRQAARPILTRKLCFNCGGPRYFARRGGVAERGNGSPVIPEVDEEEKDEHNEPYDSGYQSDVIHEEDEDGDDESALSPRSSILPTKRWRPAPRQRSSSRHRSPSRRPSWRPNLKRDLNAETSYFHRRESIDSTLSKFDEDSHSSRTQWSPEELGLLQRSMPPTIRKPSPRRKDSTLLHPSPPPETEDLQNTCSFPLAELTPPSTPPQRPPPPERQGSTLLHPSTPTLEPNTDVEEPKPFAFTFSLPAPITSQQPSTSMPAHPIQPKLTYRKNSTLLHPSSPPDDEPAPSTVRSFPFPILTKTPQGFSLPPTPQGTPTYQNHENRGSVLHSALSEDEWEAPLHSCLSDGEEYESDDHSAEGDTESFNDKSDKSSASGDEIIMALTGRMARASRISFHGNQLRILQD